ncbi:MAG TPA: hypothetical protein VML57_01505 [Burkholderiales bacterium]|jgi:hypothetical protein|nr:hypothetical protein [Burkholderiales bacterium]
MKPASRPSTAPAAARPCEIYSVPHKHSFRWKWRSLDADGSLNERPEEYSLYFDCVAAARASGYEPRSEWTSPLMLSPRPSRRPAP